MAGEASAVLAFVEVGLSFAKALREYITDYQDVPAEVLSLPNNIRDVVGLVSEVDGLLVKNETTHCWNDEGVRRAKQNILDCESIIARLRNLLQKAGISPQAQPSVEEFDISIFRQATWPILHKPRVEKVKAELDAAYNRISVTLLSYQLQSSSSMVDRAATMDKLAKLLKAELKPPRPKTSAAAKAVPSVPQQLPDPHMYSYMPMVPFQPPGAESDPATMIDLDSDTESNLDVICEQLKIVTRNEVAREVALVQAEEKAKQALADKAVQKWREGALEKWTEQEGKREQLRTELRGKMENSAIEVLVQNTFPQDEQEDMMWRSIALSSTTIKKAAPSTYARSEKAIAPSEVGTSRTSRFLSRKSRNSNGVPESELELRGMVSPAGRAHLKGFVFAYDKEFHIQCSPLGSPHLALLERTGNVSAKSRSRKMPWDEFALLPSAFRYDVEQKRNSLGDDWLLEYAERILPEKKLLRRRTDDLLGVYVIFRHYASYESPGSTVRPPPSIIGSEISRPVSPMPGPPTDESHSRKESVQPFKKQVADVIGKRGSSKRANSGDPNNAATSRTLNSRLGHLQHDTVAEQHLHDNPYYSQVPAGQMVPIPGQSAGRYFPSSYVPMAPQTSYSQQPYPAMHSFSEPYSPYAAPGNPASMTPSYSSVSNQSYPMPGPGVMIPYMGSGPLVPHGPLPYYQYPMQSSSAPPPHQAPEPSRTTIRRERERDRSLPIVIRERERDESFSDRRIPSRRGSIYDDQEIIVTRTRSSSPIPSLTRPRSPPQAPIPATTDPMSTTKPPIIQEIITHHRHMDHGFARVPRSPSSSRSPPRRPTPRSRRNDEEIDVDIRIYDRMSRTRPTQGTVEVDIKEPSRRISERAEERRAKYSTESSHSRVETIYDSDDESSKPVRESRRPPRSSRSYDAESLVESAARKDSSRTKTNLGATHTSGLSPVPEDELARLQAERFLQDITNDDVSR